MEDLSVHIDRPNTTGSGATGRNGGHLVPHIFEGMTALKARHGPFDAKKSQLLEEYTVSEIVTIIQNNGWESAVDLVEGGRVHLVFSDAEKVQIERDIRAALVCGVKALDNLERLDPEEVEKVSYPSRSTGRPQLIREHTLDLWNQISRI